LGTETRSQENPNFIGNKEKVIVFPQSSLPGYKEVLYWKISEESSRFVIMNFLPVLLAVTFGIGFFIFIRVFGGSPHFAMSNQELLIFFLGIPIVLALHEFVHGIIMQSFGARPKYGFWKQGLMFYAKAPGYAFQRNHYALIVLAPLLSLSVLVCLGIFFLAGNSIVWVLTLWAVVNAGAANVDVWITALVLRCPGSAYVVDERDGMRILLPEGNTLAE
jgi:hypothetical protein